VLINPLVKHRHVVSVSETAIVRTPAGTEPSQAVLQKRFENLAGDLSVRHQTVFMIMKIRFFMDLKVVKIRILKLIFFK
jgi:hypothetical protein